VIPGDHRVETSRDGAHHRFGARGAHLANDFHVAAQPFLPERAIGIKQDFDRLWIVECGEKSGAEIPAQFFQPTMMRSIFPVAMLTSNFFYNFPIDHRTQDFLVSMVFIEILSRQQGKSVNLKFIFFPIGTYRFFLGLPRRGRFFKTGVRSISP